MESLFDHTTAQEVINRLQKLQPQTQPLWGKMNVAQMLAHCKAPFHIYFGELKVKRPFIGILFGSIAKRKLLSNKPWPQSLPTAKELIVADNREFEQERVALMGEIERFSADGKQNRPPAHPFFGRLTPDEWGLLAYKHLDHHLRQFRV